MIESNNEKTFICLSFYTADEKLKEHEKCFLCDLKTGTNLFCPRHRDSLLKTGTVLAKLGRLECLHQKGLDKHF